MNSEKKVSVVQQSFDFDEEMIHYLSDSDEEFLTLLEEVLTEVFLSHEDEESYEYLEGQAVYFLGDEKEICAIERFDQLSLDEGSPLIEDITSLAKAAEIYFQNPRTYPTGEVVDEHEPFITGFIQLYSGEKWDSKGNMISLWKSTKEKIVVNLNDLYEPEVIISMVEAKGFKWSDIIRVTFYGHPLAKIIGSRFYSNDENRELIIWDEKIPNILLAIPEYEVTEASSPSIFDIINSEFEDSILTGQPVNCDRSSSGHWEMTLIRLDEVAQEELEEKYLLGLVTKEKLNVKTQNDFIDQYQTARLTINGLNDGSLELGAIFSLETKTLGDMLFLSEKCSQRLNTSSHYHQVKALHTKKKLLEHVTLNSPAIGIIQKINSGEVVEIHLLSEKELQAIFDILWGNLGIRILEAHKHIYLAMKDRLLSFRMRRLRSPA